MHLQEVLVITELKQDAPESVSNSNKQKEPVDDPLASQTETDGTETESGTEARTENQTENQTEAGPTEGGEQ